MENLNVKELEIVEEKIQELKKMSSDKMIELLLDDFSDEFKMSEFKRKVDKIEIDKELVENEEFIVWLSLRCSEDKNMEILMYFFERGVVFTLESFCMLVENGLPEYAIKYLFKRCELKITQRMFEACLGPIDAFALEYFTNIYMKNQKDVPNLDFGELYRLNANAYDCEYESCCLKKFKLLIKLHDFSRFSE